MDSKALWLTFGFALLASLTTYYFVSREESTSSVVNSHQEDIAKTLELFPHVDPDELHYRLTLFQNWTAHHGKQYSSSESSYRFRVWTKNYEFVQNHNSKNLSWTLSMNRFADLSNEEFAALYTGYNAAAYDAEKEAENEKSLQESLQAEIVDWRNTTAVSPVRDQGQCGDCYAFASAAGLEGLWYKNNTKITKAVVFSPQQIADCSSSYGNQGCNGGLMTYSYSYTSSFGIEYETDYPYKPATGSCSYNKTKAVFKNKGYTTVPTNYTQLLTAVKQQPVAVAVEADQTVFQLYNGGIISGAACGQQLDHAITAVGYVYDSTNLTASYWIVKNSWGTSWGVSGYVMIKMGDDNVCGINSAATYPTL